MTLILLFSKYREPRICASIWCLSALPPPSSQFKSTTHTQKAIPDDTWNCSRSYMKNKRMSFCPFLTMILEQRGNTSFDIPFPHNFSFLGVDSCQLPALTWCVCVWGWWRGYAALAKASYCSSCYFTTETNVLNVIDFCVFKM